MQEDTEMRDYVITVNSTVDLPKEWLEERHVPVVPLKYTIDGETYTDMEGLSAKEFFAKLREGKMSVTSQVNPEEAAELLEPYVKDGKDVLHLGFSSGLSGTLNSMRIAGQMLEEKYPEAKVIVIDTLCACLGEGLILYKALQQKAMGKTIDETAQQIQIFKSMSQNFPNSFWNQASSPIGNTDPVSNLTFCLWKSDITGFTDHQPYTSNRMTVFFQNHRISLSRRKNFPDYFPAVFHTCMNRPSSYRPHIRMTCISV